MSHVCSCVKYCFIEENFHCISLTSAARAKFINKYKAQIRYILGLITVHNQVKEVALYGGTLFG